MVVVCSVMSAAMDGDVFAEGVAVADNHPPRLFGHVDVLRHAAEDDAFADVVFRAEGGSFLDYRAAFEDAARTERSTRLDDAKRTDAHVRGNLGRRADHGRRVYAHGWLLMEVVCCVNPASPSGGQPQSQCPRIRDSPLQHSTMGLAAYMLGDRNRTRQTLSV